MAGMGEDCKKLLHLIPELKKEWAKQGSRAVGGDEERKLELRLGPPEWAERSLKVAKFSGFEEESEGKEKKSLQTRCPGPATAPVVGWPPVRSSFRKNIASTLKPPLSPQEQTSKPTNNLDDTKKNSLVKINMDGIPIGRKIDLKAYDSYDELSLAVDQLFRGLLAAQADAPVLKPGINGLLNGSGEYTLVYEDDEGDRMLAGDVPWKMFVATAKRLRVLKTSDLSSTSFGTVGRKRGANEC